MVRLTAELVQSSPSCSNALNDRELNLRGNKLVILENLGATQDQFDSIDFSDNEIQRIENFPLLRRVKTLYFTNNRIARIAPKLGTNLPQLHTLVIMNNKLENLGDLEPLRDLPTLRSLSLNNNNVQKKRNYRLFVVYLLPKLKVLDWSKVTAEEKRQARALFKEMNPSTTKESLEKTFVPVTSDNHAVNKTPEEIEAIKKLIENAKTLDQVQFLERSLQKGKTPKQLLRGAGGGNDDMEDEEQEEEEEEGEKEKERDGQKGESMEN